MLEEHFRNSEFYYRIQESFMGTKHDWTQAIHVIRFIDTCKYSAYLRTMYDQECHVHACQYKFTRERLITTFNEHLALPAFALLQGRSRAPAAPA